MKKFYFIVQALILGLLFCQCSSDSSGGSSSLRVNGHTFTIGTNGVGNFYNITGFQPTTDATDPDNFNTRTFTITKKSSDLSDTESITLAIIYPGTQLSINGTYDLSLLKVSPSTPYGTCSLDINKVTYGSDDPHLSTGTVTITDNGSNKFKIVFHNVVLKNGDDTTDTKTITGSVTASFAELF